MTVFHIRCAGGWTQKPQKEDSVRGICERYQQNGAQMFMTNGIVVTLVINGSENALCDVDPRIVAKELEAISGLHVIVA